MMFSIIIPHYDGVISDEVLRRGLDCLEAQTFRDFEVRLYHDGPESRPLVDCTKYSFPISYKATKLRYNNWGHSSRDLGIQESKGEYIIMFNPDNILYSNALEEIHNKSLTVSRLHINNDIIIFPIKMIGMQSNGVRLWRDKTSTGFIIFTGCPTMKNNIDCMQLVMKRSVWLRYGGWYDKSEESDGSMYPLFVRDNGALYCDSILGEHR